MEGSRATVLDRKPLKMAAKVLNDFIAAGSDELIKTMPIVVS